LFRLGLSTSSKQFRAVQDGHTRIRESLDPMSANISAMSNALPEIAISISKLVSTI
jgi:hypothetical protein